MKIVIDIPEEVYDNMVVKNEYTRIDVIALHNALMGAKPMPTEAIPVSYIQKRADTYYSKAYKNALNTIIRDWQEDKEVKNNE